MVGKPPRVAVRWLPTYGPRATPMERAFGAVHDKGTRHHQRQRRRDRGKDVEQHVQKHGPWPYKLSQRYDAPEVTVAVESRAAEKQPGLAV